MHISKNYLHDRLVLLLASINAFLALFCIGLILLRGGVGQSADGYIVQYRASLGDLSAFQKGDALPIISFMLFVLMVLGINLVLSAQTYPLRRALSLTILGLGVLLMLLAVIVSNALLALY
jgi:hypothetical protein